MRWMVGLLLGGLFGCTSLSSAYGNAASSSTGKASTGSTAATTQMRPTSGSGDSTSAGGTRSHTTAEPAVTTDVDPSIPATGTGTGAEDTANSGAAETGVSEGPVLFIYATETSFQPQPGSDPVEFCLETQPAGASILCHEEVRIPLLAMDGNVFEDVFDLADMLEPEAEVHGIEDNGLTPIADASVDMFGGLLIPLEQAGVGLSLGEEFWTGEVDDCADWALTNGGGTIGSASVTDVGWHNAGITECSQSRRILCACVSVPDRASGETRQIRGPRPP